MIRKPLLGCLTVLILLTVWAAYEWMQFRPHMELAFAVESHNYTKVSSLLNQGVNPNIPGWQGMIPIAWAAHDGDERTVKILLEHGANPNEAILAAAGSGNLQICKDLIDAGASLTGREGKYAINSAEAKPYPAIVKYLKAEQRKELGTHKINEHQ